MWRILKLLAVAIVGVNALNATDGELSLKAGVARRLGAAAGNIAACYTPFHNGIYPLGGGGTNVEQLRQAIDEDFRIMSQYFTHVRTYYSMHFDIQVAPIAAKYGLKLYLGVFLTNDAWGVQETNAAVDAVKKYSDTVEVILVGNENIVYQESWMILNKVNEIKARAGGDAWRVKYGTVQRAAEYINPAFDWKMRPLADALDILGINIYPCFDNGYNGNDPTAMLTWQWNAAASRYPASKLRLTETGYSTGGGPHWLSPRVVPNLDASQRYYEGVVNWSPPGAAGTPKFWFQAFDRRWGDPSAQGIEMELYFGFFTTNKQQKRGGFPRAKGDAEQNVELPGQVGADTGADVSGCPLEAGVDFLNNDIGSAPSSKPQGCFAACNANARCGAFSWTNANGGTCWLKTHKNSVAFNGAVTSGVKCTGTSTNTNNCPVEFDTDYVGNDIGNAPAAKVDLCFGLCRSRNGCGAFSWAGNTCYFKSKKEGTKRNGGVHSGTIQCSGPAPTTAPTTAPVPTPTPTPTPAPGPVAGCGTLETNVDYVGNDLGVSKWSKDAQGCFSLCAGVGGCNAFSWLDGTCYFKSRKGNTGRKDRVVSGVRCANAPVDQTNANKLEENVDYIGLDITSRSAKEASECFGLCANRSGCRAFTWTDYNGGTCWLKSGKGQVVGKAKSMSGVIAV